MPLIREFGKGEVGFIYRPRFTCRPYILTSFHAHDDTLQGSQVVTTGYVTTR